MIATEEWQRESSQWPQLAACVPRWLKEVPLYQRRPLTTRCSGLLPEFLRCFRSLPIITKEDIRNGFPGNFLPHGTELEQLLDAELVELERTSGTSEQPTPLLLARGWWNRQEDAALRLNGWISSLFTHDTRRVTIISPVCSSEINYADAPACSQRTVRNTLFVNLSRHPFVWSDAALEQMVQESLAWQPLFLDVDPVYGVLFALYCERHQVRLPTLKFILSSYEYLSVVHRRVLQRVFGVPVLNLYGSTETGHLLMENEQGDMVPSHGTAYLELLNPDRAGIGELVVTTLSNDFMPLIRYSIGDLVRRRDETSQRAFELHGRIKDALLSSRGERVTVRQVDGCFQNIAGVAHYHLRQGSGGHFTLFYAPDSNGVLPPCLDDLALHLQDILGVKDGLLSIRAVDYLPCESSGKFRLCMNESGTPVS